MSDTQEIKAQVKEALTEFFNENSEALRITLSEIIEDIALGKAIEEADSGDYADENAVIAALKSNGG